MSSRRRVKKLERDLAARRLELRGAAIAYAERPVTAGTVLDIAALAFAAALEELRVAEAAAGIAEERS